MDWTQIIVTIISVFFSGSGIIGTLIITGKKTQKISDDITLNIKQITNLMDNEDKKIKSNTVTLDALNKSEQLHKYSLQKQIKYTLTRLHRECGQRGYITRYEFECANELNDEYKKLGGNSFVKEIMKDIADMKLITEFSNQERK